MMLMPSLHIPLILSILNWVLVVLLAVMIFVVGCFFVRYGFKQFLFQQCNKNETWLPVVDDAGYVIGRVAKSISQEEPGKYQHPLIRVLVWHDGMLYLRSRTSEFFFEKGLMDHPFEQLLLFGNSIEDNVMCLRNQFFKDSEKPRFMLKYKHENKEGKWLVLLYLIVVSDNSQLIQLHGRDGKLWTSKQIIKNSGMGYFSSIFEGEIDFFNSLLFK